MATVSPQSSLGEPEGADMESREVAIRNLPGPDRRDVSLGPSGGWKSLVGLLSPRAGGNRGLSPRGKLPCGAQSPRACGNRPLRSLPYSPV
jgi:hypothetical protein